MHKKQCHTLLTTGEKPCINKAIHALLMHGYASCRGHRFASVTRCVLPGPRTSIVRGNCVRATSGKRRNKIVQEIMRNVACFQFLCNNSDRTWFFNALTFARSLGRCSKPRKAAVFNTSLGTWRMLMHEKTMFDPYNKKKDSSFRFKKKTFILSFI